MKPLLDTSVLAIACIGAALSVTFSFVILPHIIQTHNVNLDPDGNGALAYHLSAGYGMRYREADSLALDRGPVYPFLVAGLFSLAGGYALWSVQIFQALLHAATSLVVYLLGLRLYNRVAALGAQLLCSIHPILLWYTGRIWIETTHAFMLVLTALAVVALYDQINVARALRAGAAFGLSALTKSVIMLFPFVLMLLLIRKHHRMGLKGGMIVLAVCYAVIFPWTVRNYHVSGEFVPVHTSLGFNLIQGDVVGEHWPEQWCCNLDFWRMGQARVDSLLQPRGIASFRGVEGESVLTQEAIRRYLEDPLFLPRKVVANFFLLWSLSESPLKSFVYGSLQWLLLLGAGVAYFQGRKQNPLLTPLVALTLYYVLVHASIVGWARYSMPIIPLLILLACSLVHRMNEGRVSR